MGRIFCILLVLFCTKTATAQMLDNSNCAVFSTENFFNPVFVQKNDIKSIKSQISTKQEMKPIKKTPLWQQYDFDKYGRIARMMETHYVGRKIDTSLVQFQYEENHLIKKRLSDLKGFYSYTYQYNKEGKMTKKTYSREVNANPETHNFVLGQLIEIYIETYEHNVISDTRTKTTIYNSDNKPYQQLFYDYDKYGNLIKETSTLIVTKKGTTTTYIYDAYHRIIEKNEVNNLFGKSETHYAFEYDEAGNILEERKYEDGVHKTTRQFLYDGRMLLSARLTKNEQTGTIQIVKYKCFFH